jgi:Coenzyme PQQ synthesis protein D (PqqD)
LLGGFASYNDAGRERFRFPPLTNRPLQCICSGRPASSALRKELGTEMNGPLSVVSIVGATREQVSCMLGDEAAILNMKNTVYYGLNPVGARVWNLVQQSRSVREIRDTLLEEYDVEAEQCERDLLALLEKMREQGLIEVREARQAAP